MPIAMALSCLLHLFCLLFTTTAAATTATTFTLQLTPLTTKISSSSSDSYKLLNSFASSSLSRAQHLKSKSTSKTKTNSSFSPSTPLYSHSYGGYSISLSFGTPPQTIPLVFDTGSSLVWLPCTSRYRCSQCSFPNVDPSHITTYIPKNSSSSKLIGCNNPKCTWIFGLDVESRCKNCDPNDQKCTETCPPYIIEYGLGSTAGLLLSETLVFPNKKRTDFLVGCSIVSNRQPAGIGGFGRSRESLPSQLGVKKFSYCLLSRNFDDTPVSSNLVLDTGSGSGDSKTSNVSYTPFLKNPTGVNSAFGDYYYLLLRKIVVGNKHVKVPYIYLAPRSDGNGGTIVDSGSTFTFMERPVYEAVAQEFIKQMANYSRARDVENQTGLKPCYKISGDESVPVPGLIFQFKGGAKMSLPLENYFALLDSNNVLCLMIVTDNSIGPGLSGAGPAIILGSFQVQNFFLEFDLANERFGFTRKTCS